MNDQNHRSAAEVMANAARVVKAAVNIVRAAIAGGASRRGGCRCEGALPTIIKFAVGVLIAIIVIPIFVISAMPNMFFSVTKRPKRTRRSPCGSRRFPSAAHIYRWRTLKRRSRTPSSPAKLPRMRIRASRSMRSGCPANSMKKIFCWYIAINSVAHKQDLSEMKPEEVQSLLIPISAHDAAGILRRPDCPPYYLPAAQ